jgi:hypothetical protein
VVHSEGLAVPGPRTSTYVDAPDPRAIWWVLDTGCALLRATAYERQLR